MKVLSKHELQIIDSVDVATGGIDGKVCVEFQGLDKTSKVTTPLFAAIMEPTEALAIARQILNACQAAGL